MMKHSLFAASSDSVITGLPIEEDNEDDNDRVIVKIEPKED